MEAVVTEPTPETIPATESAEYSIDALSALTGVPSRTIRFYQSNGTLRKPEKRGRKAVYGDDHVERLALIGTLQDRGLRIRAIKELVQRIDRGEMALEDWLGMEARLGEKWSADEATLLTAEALEELLGERSPGLVGELVRVGLLERRDAAFFAESPARVRAVARLHAAGIEVDVAMASLELSAKHLARMAHDLTEHFVRHAGRGFGASASPSDLSDAFDAVRPVTQAAVQAMFGREMEQQLRGLIASGKAARLGRR